jgi:3-(3-hydroxy-phenyl)propionate hydroxylase
LNGPDALDGPSVSRVGSTCPDAPLETGFLLDELSGDFTILALNTDAPNDLTIDGIQLKTLIIDAPTADLKARYLGDQSSAIYLIRPDQHVAARWNRFDEAALRSAMSTALAKEAA